MKKITLLALAAMLVLLTGCKHDDAVTLPAEDLITDNPIVKLAKYGKTLYGLDTTTIKSNLDEEDWVYAGESMGYTMFSKVRSGIDNSLGYVCKDGIATEIVGMTFYQRSATPVLTEPQAFKGTMQYIGENYIIDGHTCPFVSMTYEENGEQVEINNYPEALEKVQSIAETVDIDAIWSDNTHSFTLRRVYSAPNKKVFNVFYIK